MVSGVGDVGGHCCFFDDDGDDDDVAFWPCACIRDRMARARSSSSRISIWAVVHMVEMSRYS
ncbi:hypothetical protein IscW_ISCW017781 [Ixodes scapularis]|uniref:Uncharacterized protein n=1 Tax=Ixodes scapularis TaxID=6945 RepID=B7PK66_IXOSC|nr:hypothetical protein IscW_ISCW017781 [Ixodes scapularis]|eukprot:XP_002409451.1 hypothetical protein IscW_ISCW017781 [Ixodes scapularis]